MWNILKDLLIDFFPSACLGYLVFLLSGSLIASENSSGRSDTSTLSDDPGFIKKQTLPYLFGICASCIGHILVDIIQHGI